MDLSAGPGDRLSADLPALPDPGDRGQERAEVGAADPRAQPLQPDGPLLHRALPAPPDPVHGEIAALRPAGPDLRLQARRRVPDPPRPPRRGGLQDRLHGARPGRDAADLRRGRPLTQRRARRPETGRRQARARIRRPGRPGRDPRLRVGAALEAVPVPEGEGPVRRADHLPGREGGRSGAPARGRIADLRPGPRPCTGGSTRRAAAAAGEPGPATRSGRRASRRTRGRGPG